MGTIASPAWPLANILPKMDFARGMISLAVIARPTPTIQPRPRELLMPEAVAASHATTVLSRCFPGNPGIARFWLAGGDERTYLPDDKKLELTRDELAEVLRATYTVAERGYI